MTDDIIAGLRAKTPPPDCPPARWIEALVGVERFIRGGWGEKAEAAGWTRDELYRVPELWAQVHRLGAALVIGRKKVVGVTKDTIEVETESGARLNIYRTKP